MKTFRILGMALVAVMLDAAQIAALEKEFMETFETFTVILSLSKK